MNGHTDIYAGQAKTKWHLIKLKVAVDSKLILQPDAFETIMQGHDDEQTEDLNSLASKEPSRFLQPNFSFGSSQNERLTNKTDLKSHEKLTKKWLNENYAKNPQEELIDKINHMSVSSSLSTCFNNNKTKTEEAKKKLPKDQELIENQVKCDCNLKDVGFFFFLCYMFL
jgi:hypothetical protein